MYLHNNILCERPSVGWQGCAGATACCIFNNPPWFVRDLIASTREDIEMSMCNAGGFSSNEDSPFDTDTCSKHYFATNFE